jgi:hypothetical protein
MEQPTDPDYWLLSVHSSARFLGAKKPYLPHENQPAVAPMVDWRNGWLQGRLFCGVSLLESKLQHVLGPRGF